MHTRFKPEATFGSNWSEVKFTLDTIAAFLNVGSEDPKNILEGWEVLCYI